MDLKILKIPNHSHFNDFFLKITEEKKQNMKANDLFHKFYILTQIKIKELRGGKTWLQSSLLS